MRTVISEDTPSDVVSVDQINATMLYGIEHREYNNNGKKYKVHRCRNETFMAIGFRNSTGHLNEAEGFDSLQSVFEYCQSRNHKMLEFSNKDDFANWLLQ